MDFFLTKEQKEYQKEIVRFAANNLNDPEGLEVFSRENWNKAADFGLFSLSLEEEYGGLGESFLTAAVATEALGYACRNNGFVFAVTNHVWVGANMIQLYGSPFLKDKYLSLMAQGEKIGCFALTEADSGSDATSMKMTAREDQDSYLLNGNKMFVSNGNIADIFIVIARNAEMENRYTAFVVEKDFDGFQTGEEIEKMGLGGCPTCEIILNNCRVPKENILGTLYGGSAIMTAALEWERCYEFAPHVGAMQRIMELCLEQAEKRKQFGKPIGNFQGISHKIADMKVAVEMARLMLYKVAWLKDQRKSAYVDASIFKLYVSEQYIRVCQNAIQIFGAYGYCREYGLERELRDALACSIYSGTSEIQRNTIYDMASLFPFGS